MINLLHGCINLGVDFHFPWLNCRTYFPAPPKSVPALSLEGLSIIFSCPAGCSSMPVGGLLYTGVEIT